MNIVKKICSNFVMWIVCKNYVDRINQKLIQYKSFVYTMWLRNFFDKVGEGVKFYYPIQLQGKGVKNICIGSRTTIQSNCILGCRVNDLGHESLTPIISIGDDCTIGEFCQITAIRKIIIGNGLLTGRFVYIGDNSHGELSWKEATIPPARRILKSKGGIVIGNNVWIGDKVTILAGVTIGDNVIIGANSVVTRNIPSNSVAAGNPAKVVKCLES